MPNFDLDVFRKSDSLAEKLQVLIDIPLLNDSARIITSDVACSLSFEHWHAVRVLLEGGLLPSSIVIHRAQFEALVRSVCIKGTEGFKFNWNSAACGSVRFWPICEVRRPASRGAPYFLADFRSSLSCFMKNHPSKMLG